MPLLLKLPCSIRHVCASTLNLIVLRFSTKITQKKNQNSRKQKVNQITKLKKKNGNGTNWQKKKRCGSDVSMDFFSAEKDRSNINSFYGGGKRIFSLLIQHVPKFQRWILLRPPHTAHNLLLYQSVSIVYTAIVADNRRRCGCRRRQQCRRTLVHRNWWNISFLFFFSFLFLFSFYVLFR